MGLEQPTITLGNGILNAFDFFPTPAQVVQPSSDNNKRFVCGFVMGSASPANISGTGCGLYALIKKTNDSLLGTQTQIEQNLEYFKINVDVQNDVYVFTSRQGLINVVNKINNLANLILFTSDPSRTATATATNAGLFNSLNQNLFFGAYTGKQNIDSNDDGVEDGDLMGNGITAAFGFSSITTPDTDLAQIIGNDGAASRAGLELYALLNYLKYGGVAVLAARYLDLAAIKNGFRYPTLAGLPLDPNLNGLGALFNNRGLDAIVTLEGGSMLTGVGLTGNATNDAMIYGGAFYGGTGQIGSVYNRTQGLLPEHLGNTFGGTSYRGNIFSSIITDISSPSYLQIFHAGLSGTSFGYQQEFGDDPKTVGVFRHPSTDNLPFFYRRRFPTASYPGSLTSPGITSGVLNEFQLNSLVCVGGRTLTKTWWTTTGTQQGEVVGGGADGSYWIPKLDVIEFAGSMNRAFQNTQGTYMLSSNIGAGNPVVDSIPNAAQRITSTRYGERSTELLIDLAAKRINTICSNNPAYFPTDYMGTTGPIASATILSRRYVQAIYGYAYTSAFNIVNGIVGGNVVNDNATRANVVSAIDDEYRSSSFRSYLREDYTITCNSSNNNNNSSTLIVDITVKPAVFTINSPFSAALTSFNIRITIS